MELARLRGRALGGELRSPSLNRPIHGYGSVPDYVRPTEWALCQVDLMIPVPCGYAARSELGSHKAGYGTESKGIMKAIATGRGVK